MWKRCWWVTWISGFFGIAGFLHLLRPLIRLRIVVGSYDVPMGVSVSVGVAFLFLSAGLLWIEVLRERARRRAKDIPS